MSKSAEIEHVADTALWVAVLRAREGERKDALFRDPLAELLAGERGRELAKTMPGRSITQWVMGLRTQALDRLLTHAIERGVDTILNLGAGLDTRPYRMNLPRELRWLEVDFPAIIELKNERLAEHEPRCRLERVSLDLGDESVRHEELTRLLATSKQTAVLTEGVLMYLTPEQVDSLAAELRSLPSVRYWLQDYNNGPIPGSRRRQLEHSLRSAPWRFVVYDWFGYFERRGFGVAEKILLTDEVRRLRRFPPGWPVFMLRHLFSSAKQREFNRTQAGWVMFEKLATP